MSFSQNRAFEWVPQDLQPFVLGFLVLTATARFLYVLWPKWRIFQRAPFENRINSPVKRLGHTFRIAFLQAKMFKEAKAGWMHALIFWGFLIFLLRAAWFFFIGFFPMVELDGGGGETLYLWVKDSLIVLVVLATTYALYRRTVVKPERLTLSIEGIVILVLILAIIASDALFDAGWQARNPQTEITGIWLGSLIAPVLSILGSDVVVHLHNLAYWVHVLCILYF